MSEITGANLSPNTSFNEMPLWKREFLMGYFTQEKSATAYIAAADSKQRTRKKSNRDSAGNAVRIVEHTIGGMLSNGTVGKKKAAKGKQKPW